MLKKLLLKKMKKEKIHEKILIKSDGINNFSLRPDSTIYIYSENKHGLIFGSYNFSQKKIKNKPEMIVEIISINSKKDVNCLSKSFKQNIKINISSLSDDCQDSIYFKARFLKAKTR